MPDPVGALLIAHAQCRFAWLWLSAKLCGRGTLP